MEIKRWIKRKLKSANRRTKRTAQNHPLISSIAMVMGSIFLVLAVAYLLGPKITMEPDLTTLSLLLVVAGLVVRPAIGALRDKKVSLSEAPLFIVMSVLGVALFYSVLVISGIAKDTVAGALTVLPLAGMGIALLIFVWIAVLYSIHSGGDKK